MRTIKQEPRKQEKQNRSQLIVEMKYFLQRPLSNDYNELLEEMRNVIKGEDEPKFAEATTTVEPAMSLEELFNGLT